ncbi:sulfur carrier protein ThiS [Candidiatus Paracoxiella cheracis]|uniref:sulfur carrier protein ThiS n=1 Tax=Candidiatus Paracoxiella cheracis TaxID=3405120 RepID=UPI003BF47C52
MLNIILNRNPHIIKNDSTVADVVHEMLDVDRTFAIAVNKTFISKQDYHKTILKDGDCVDVVEPMVGG